VTCYTPNRGWYSAALNKNGKRYWTRNPALASGEELSVPCNDCEGCRLDNARGWGIRSMHEAKMRDPYNCSFITLTYKKETLPYDCMIFKEEMQDFFKRLRYYTGSNSLSYLYCGEYGGRTRRPHYHAIVFGENFLDKSRTYKIDKRGNRLWNSDLLDAAWQGRGYGVVAKMTFKSALYVARYSLKKEGKVKKSLARQNALDQLKFLTQRDERDIQQYLNCHTDLITGEIVDRQQPFAHSSTRPALGLTFIQKYLSDIYPSDSIPIDGYNHRPPPLLR